MPYYDKHMLMILQKKTLEILLLQNSVGLLRQSTESTESRP